MHKLTPFFSKKTVGASKKNTKKAGGLKKRKKKVFPNCVNTGFYIYLIFVCLFVCYLILVLLYTKNLISIRETWNIKLLRVSRNPHTFAPLFAILRRTCARYNLNKLVIFVIKLYSTKTTSLIFQKVFPGCRIPNE